MRTINAPTSPPIIVGSAGERAALAAGNSTTPITNSTKFIDYDGSVFFWGSTADEWLEITINEDGTYSGYSDSIADKPSAALFGAGTWQVGSAVYLSNGVAWKSQDEYSGVAQLRSLAKIESQKRPLIQAPLWEVTTAYVIGNIVRHSNGQLMICTVAGTSLSSEPTFSATAQMVESGGPKWGALGYASRLNSDGYDIPSITVDTTAPTSSAARLLLTSNASLAGKILGTAITAGGSGYVDGVYTNVPLTTLTGTGSGAISISVTVSGGAVTVIKYPAKGSTGSGYLPTDTQTINNSYLGGSGSGLVLTSVNIVQPVPTWCTHDASEGILYYSNGQSYAFFMNSGSSNPGPASSWGIRTLEFISDDDNPGLKIYNADAACQVTCYVDGYLVSEAYPLCAVQNSYYKLDWSGIRKMRKYRFEIPNGYSITGVYVKAESVVLPISVPNLKAAYFGDSFHNLVDSTYSFPANSRCLAHEIFRRVGIWSVRDYGIGGSGYYAGKDVSDNNTTTGTFNTYALLQNNSLADFDAKVIVFAQGYNDQNNTVATTVDRAVASWNKARSDCPNAVIVIFGPWTTSTGPNAANIALDTALQAAFTTWGDGRSVYHPQANDINGAWTAGTGKQGTVVAGSNASYYISQDGTHPSTVGKEYLINRMKNLIDQDLIRFGL